MTCIVQNTQDLLLDLLHSRGYHTTNYTLSEHDRSFYIGPRVVIGNSEIIYRLPEPGLLLVVLYRRLSNKNKSLTNCFSDLLWFLQCCTEPEVRLERVMCFISTYRYRYENGLTDERMIQFCCRFLGAKWIEYDGAQWLYQDVELLRAKLGTSKKSIQKIP